MNENVQIVFGLLGGLALFIFGMTYMSDGLQKAAGERMRKILAMITRNPIIMVLTGALVTAVLQSSGATTVMVIGFVSAGLMTLPNAIAIIMGANIGTTVTAQIIAFDIDDYIWPIIFIGFVMYFIGKSERIKYSGQTIFAFGLLFLGIATMSNVMKPLANSPTFISMMQEVSNTPILGVTVGALMTMVVQSSSASIAVLQNLAAQAGPDGISSVLGLAGALPILYGSNIGSTCTAILASIGGSVNAKRTAAAHAVFNISGAVIAMFFIPQFVWLVEKISPQGPEYEVIARQIANAHTIFNVIFTILWLPFIWFMVKIVTKIIPDKVTKLAESDPIYLDYNLIDKPVFALDMVTRELQRLIEMTDEMVYFSRKGFIGQKKEAIKTLLEKEATVDILQENIVKYLSSIFSAGELSERQAVRVSGLMHIASDIERIGDHCTNIAEFATQKIDNGYYFSDEAISELESGFDQIQSMVHNCVIAMKTGEESVIQEIMHQEEELDNLEGRLRVNHIRRLNEGICSAEFTVIFTDVIHNMERIGDHCNNIAEALAGEARFATEASV